MSTHLAFRRQPVPQQFAQNLKTSTMPAPTRGLSLDENEAFMQPGSTIVQTNWLPTMRGVKLRGGTARWCDLHALDATVPPVPSPLRKPVISAFEYRGTNNERMFAAQEDKLFDVTASVPVLVKSGQASGNYSSAQMANAGGDYLVALNDAGDFPLRFNGTSWITLTGDPAGVPTDGASNITYDPADLPVGIAQGTGLVYVWKYRNRLFFIQINSMQAWYLGIDSVGGVLQPIPLSGSASLGGHLVAGFSWSLDAGDGLSEKNCFLTSEGEVLIFEGTDPGNAASWRQQGRYYVSPPMGMNAHMRVGGDILIATIEGLVPMSQAITKARGQLDLAMFSRAIKPLWREEVAAKRDQHWSMEKWDEFGGMFIATPGGAVGERFCLASNNASGAWCRLTWDATCFIRLRADMFFGTQDGIIMQAESTGKDDGQPYVCTLVGGWETFRSGSALTVWHQARAIFTAGNREQFIPQLDATTDYIITIPQPPPAGVDPGVEDVWDQGLWDQALWDQPSLVRPSKRNTMWVSIGKTGFSHALIVQITVAQQAKPDVELIAVGTIFEPAGVNV